MAQRVEFSFFPGVRDELLWPTVNKVLGQIQRSQMTFRDFRDWLKDAGLWHKEESAALLGFLDIHTEPHVQLGPWAQQVFAAKDDAAAKDLLYKRLCDENLLLVKYVLEALDVEGGGRLHSTSELHRMLTSYVYPGKHLGRVQFEAWIKWIVASGRVKLIGIRWGLTDLGKQAVPRLRTVDADEFLEDESAPQTQVLLPEPAPVPLLKQPAPLPAEPLTPTKPNKPSKQPQPPVEEEELPDMPPEAEPVDETLFARYEAQMAHTSPLPTTAPQPHVQTQRLKAVPKTPQASNVQPGNSPCNQPPLSVQEVVAALRQYGLDHGLAAESLLEAHGLEARMAQNEAGRHLFVASLLARLHAHADGPALATLLHERAGGWGPVALLLDRPEALTECLQRWNLTGAEPQAGTIRQELLEATLGGRALKMQADLPTLLAEAQTAEDLLAKLENKLLRTAPTSALFWLVREMVRAGLWQKPAALEAAFVPSRPVRLMAYRLRLLDNHFAQSLPGWLNVARRLAPLFPPLAVETIALETLAPHDHLRFDCVRVLACEIPCGQP